MPPVATGRFGRPAAATRQEALALATTHFLAGQRVDVQGIARELGLARATMHRWFGTREVLLGEMLAELGEARLLAHRQACKAVGARAVRDSLHSYNQELVTSPGLRALLAQEQERALRILTSTDGVVQPRIVAVTERLLEAEIEAGTFVPTLTPSTLAYALVRLGEAFIYNDAAIGIRGDIMRLREVHSALLGVRPSGSTSTDVGPPPE